MSTLEIKEFIRAKQENQSHSEEEIDFFISNLDNFAQEEITKWLKAVKVNGLSDNETSALTLAMAKSGLMLNWEGLEPTIDKHSTGGIGDKVTLLFMPLVAAYGSTYHPRIYIPKLSGRALGITGGTIDKLESISGFRTNLTVDEIKEQVKKISLAICSATVNLAPADKKLYAIRDVTDTIDSIPLIASSVMSKKIAGGAKNIILDVKFGSGAFMKKLQDAKFLGTKMVTIGKKLGRNTKAVVTNMDQPLGYAVGNALEIKEVLEVLSGKEVADLTEVVVSLAKEVVELLNLKIETNIEEKLRSLLLGGQALKSFEELVLAQGGNLKIPLPKAKYVEILTSESEGYITSIDALSIGTVVHNLGAGRKTISDEIDRSVGIVFHKKYGDKVIKGESLLEIHAKSTDDAKFAKKETALAIKIGQNRPPKLKLVEEIIK